MKNNLKKQKGFTLLYSVLVSSIVLAASLSIVTISLKQHKLAALSRESQVAFYAANTGIDCAVYWDVKGRDVTVVSTDDTNLDIFPRVATDAEYDNPLSSGDDSDEVTRIAPFDPQDIYCLGESILDSDKFYEDNGNGTPLDDFYNFTSDAGGSYWNAHFQFSDGDVQEEYCLDDSNTSDYRTWTFQVVLPDSSGAYSKDNSCAVVSVCKNLDSGTNLGYDTIYTARGYNTCDITKENVVERGVVLIQN